MSQQTSIEWTKCPEHLRSLPYVDPVGATWNPATGCDPISPGCANCYAERFAERFRGVKGHYFENGFDVQLRPNMLSAPLTWRKSKLVFISSMSDMFHENIPDGYILNVFEVMRRAYWHQFLLLTKRPERMAEIGKRLPDWPINVWAGTSVESQAWTWRIDELLKTPAQIRFLSCEPLLGPLDLKLGDRSGLLHQVIVGGESGPDCRPLDPDWARSIRQQCQDAGVAFNMKLTPPACARRRCLC